LGHLNFSKNQTPFTIYFIFSTSKIIIFNDIIGFNDGLTPLLTAQMLCKPSTPIINLEMLNKSHLFIYLFYYLLFILFLKNILKL
jgi:hypothetical protein